MLNFNPTHTCTRLLYSNDQNIARYKAHTIDSWFKIFYSSSLYYIGIYVFIFNFDICYDFIQELGLGLHGSLPFIFNPNFANYYSSHMFLYTKYFVLWYCIDIVATLSNLCFIIEYDNDRLSRYNFNLSFIWNLSTCILIKRACFEYGTKISHSDCLNILYIIMFIYK